MGNCDMCNRPVDATTAARFSPAQVQAAARVGYRPAVALDSALWQGLGLSPDEARQQAEGAWLNLVQNSRTDWVLCDICAAQFRPYLPGGMRTPAPVAGGTRPPMPSRPTPVATAAPLTPREWLQKRWWLLAGVALLVLLLARGAMNWVTARATTLPAPTLTSTLSTTATSVEAPAFSGDGRLLAVGSSFQQGADWEYRLEVWDVTTGQLVHSLTPDTNGVEQLAFSPDGQTLAVAGMGDQVELWDLSTEQRRFSLNLPALTFQKDLVLGLAFSPDGQWLAAGGLEAVTLWEVGTGAPAQSLALSACQALSFSPDGRWLVCQSLSSSVLTVWNVTQNQLGVILDCGNLVEAAPRFSPDGQWLAAVGGSATGAAPRLCRWQVADWQPLSAPALDDLKVASALAFSPDGRFELVVGIAQEQSGMTSTLWLWDLSKGKLRGRRSDLPTWKGLFSPDTKQLVLLNSSPLEARVTAWDLTPLFP